MPLLETQALPSLSAAMPSGRRRPPPVTERSGVPSGASTWTLSLPLPVTQARPAGSTATPNGFCRESVATARACSARPSGIRVTLRPPQLAIQIVPARSARTPCGCTMPPRRQPVSGESAVPSPANCETLRLKRFSSSSQPAPWKPKLPTQAWPLGSTVTPKPAP